ncbi:MAG: trypsin-like peptidase domain-containing protein [Melioribacteraceae bacterium]|nr:trypsin-like peptidase domain-containing protein [Melioribacteraceae bacterium]
MGRIEYQAFGQLRYGGTVWIASNGKLVTAAHVISGYQSLSNFKINFDPVNNNQDHFFYIESGSIVEGNSQLGDDWGVFDAKNSSNETPFQKYGNDDCFNIQQSSVLNKTVEITGYLNNTGMLETTTGTVSDISSSSDGIVIEFTNLVKMGHSGAPIILQTTGNVIGIAKQGPAGGELAKGTSIVNQNFADALGLNTININQYSSNNLYIPSSKIGHWEIDRFFEYDADSEVKIYNDPNLTETIKPHKDIVDVSSNKEKFKNWEASSDIVIHRNIQGDQGIYNVASKMGVVYSGITIKNNIEGMNVSAGNIMFFDPWFEDRTDPDHGNNKYNYGMTEPLQFRTRESGFSPSYSDPFNGIKYKGVFLNQYPSTNDPLTPCYSVKAFSEQSFLFDVTGKVQTFYFQNWSGSGVLITDPGNIESSIAFNSSSAQVSALLKGTQLTNSSGAYSNNNQRKIVRTLNSHLHQVYESMGKVWYERSTDNGNTWQLMNGGAPLDNDNCSNPSIDYMYNTVAIVYSKGSLINDIYNSF